MNEEKFNGSFPDVFNGSFPDVRATRSNFVEIVVVAVVLALAVNLLSGGITEVLGSTSAIVLGALLAVSVGVYIAVQSFRSRTVELNPSAVFVTASHEDDESGRPSILSVPEYDFAEDFAMKMKFLFAENPALKRQWFDSIDDTGQVEGVSETFVGRRVLPEKSADDKSRIICEMAEFVVLEWLSIHLEDYFNGSEFQRHMLSEMKRDDLPSIVLQNRVLDTFTKDMKDRAVFDRSDWEVNDEDKGQVMMVMGPDRYYFRFGLTLPKGSEVSRRQDGTVTIRNKSIELAISVNFSGADHFVNSNFVRYYLKCDDQIDVRLCSVDFKIVAKIKSRTFMYGRALAYHKWLESFTDSIGVRIDFEEFLRGINWATVDAILQSAVNLPRNYGKADQGRHDAT